MRAMPVGGSCSLIVLVLVRLSSTQLTLAWRVARSIKAGPSLCNHFESDPPHYLFFFFFFFFFFSPRPASSSSSPIYTSPYLSVRRPELADPEQLEGEFASETDQRETVEQRDKFLVLRLYEALGAGDRAAVHSLLAPDLEWWFHGPPNHQHMMRLLTGTPSSFSFVPRSVDALPGSGTVIAEGASAGECYWVHAWTVGDDGVITQLREYFNTDLTVTRLLANSAGKCCVWQSRRPDSARNSLPCLLLAL